MNGASNPIWNDRVFIGFLVASLIGVLVQITMGGAVRVTGSGDGCPDWPLCYGRLIPPFEFHALMEYTHRTIGVIVGLAAIGATLRVLAKHRREAPVATTVTAALVGITITGAIGGAVVLSELSPALRTLHLMLAETVALLLVHATVATFYTRNMSREGNVSNALIIWSALAAGLTLVALLSGSYAVWQGAGPICSSWPLCGGPLIPQYEAVWIHMAHRVLALAAAVPSLVAAHLAMKPTKAPQGAEHIRTLGLLAVTIVAAQVLLGAANPWTGFAQWARVAHLTVATLQWAVMAALFFALLMPKRREATSSPDASDHATNGRTGEVAGSDAVA